MDIDVIPEAQIPASDLAPPENAEPEERPPLGSWPRLYALVIGALVLDVVLFYLFTRTFS